MKILYFFPLLFLSACSTAPRPVLTPQPPPPVSDNSTVRYPEVIRAYHVGRYADPNDDLVMHEQHVVYRVEENTRWDLRPAAMGNNAFTISSMPHDAAFNPPPVNEAVLAEVNSQRLATTQIMMQARTLSAALAQFQAALQQTKTNFQEMALLRVTVNEMQKRLDVLATSQAQPPAPSISTTNEPAESLSP
jgi:hypothetical protein